MVRSSGGVQAWSALRMVVALLVVAAIARQLFASVTRSNRLDLDVGTVVVNFFSFFTVLSNAATAVVLAWAALWCWSRRRGADTEPAGLATALASVTTYMVITGLVYNLLLRNVDLPQGSAPVPWSNEVLHVVAPAFLLLDLFVGPLRRALPWRAVLSVIVFPVLWLGYTFLRGPLTTDPISGAAWWYPYPFLNPNNPDLVPSGYAGVSVYVVAVAAAILVVAALVVWVGRRRGRA